MPDFKKYFEDYTNKEPEVHVEQIDVEPLPIDEEVEIVKKATEQVLAKETKKEEKPVKKKKAKEPVAEKTNTEELNMLVEAINKLVEKIDTLQKQKIDIPPPIVHVTLPDRSIVREVHRDETGKISKIVEHVEKDEDNE